MNVKKDFPIFDRKINENRIVYLDSAATSQKPIEVIESMNDFYEKGNSNIHRGIYTLSEEATNSYEEAREKIAKFINARNNEIIFTKGTTESLNILAYSLTENLKEGDIILLTELEHHANLIPWQVMSKKKGLKLKFIPVDNEGNLIIDEKLFENAKIVSISHVSNALGTLNDIKTIEILAHKKNALLIIDAAQSISHIKIDVKELNCDFLAFSGHKVFGPMGIGVLYGKKEFLEVMEPFIYGGDMISEVSFHDSTWNEVPFKFEAGTQNIAGAIGLGKAIDYVNKIGISNIQAYEKELTYYLTKKLSEFEKIKIYKPKNISNIVSFNIKNVHAHDTAQLLSEHGICVRAGHHCCMPLMDKLGISGTTRVSLSIYNDEKDIDLLIEILKTIIKKFD